MKKRKRDDYARSLGCSGLKGLTRFGQRIFFSSVKKTKGSSTCSGSMYLLGASKRYNAGFKDYTYLALAVPHEEETKTTKRTSQYSGFLICLKGQSNTNNNAMATGGHLVPGNERVVRPRKPCQLTKIITIRYS